ncbi:NRAMP family divalent metal transporter [Halalkalicoccus subterraneus]|uniref:NRAMP family divalent metal transporter n=1 Tax=Halalkalicoccus subterraneus TaxID=2675002 RepID=UPI000EFA42E3|nr:divalent metal cation transporter [Halalkalicoccus subterraneus]
MGFKEKYGSNRSGVQYARRMIHDYGLGVLFAANVFGAGSVYILSNTGANFAFALLWVMPLAFVIDMGLHEMSGRLATIDEPLMFYIRDVVGATAGKAFAITISFIMHFWSIANYAVGGAALAWLLPVNNVYITTIVVAAIGFALVELRVYDRIEAAVTVLILAVFSIYIVLTSGLELQVAEVASGFVPAISGDLGYMATVIGLLGTTVYYPNFFIQSSIQSSKGWTDMKPYRRDNVVGVSFAVLLSMAVIIVSAATLEEGTPTLTSPGEPLTAALGEWALVVFVIAVFLASITSATGTLFGAGYIVPQAWGHDAVFGDRSFRRVVEVLIVMSVGFAILLLEFTEMTPVRLGIVMPAVNGIIGLPLTTLALYYANERFFDHPIWLRAFLGALVVLMFVASALSAQDLATQVLSWL